MVITILRILSTRALYLSWCFLVLFALDMPPLQTPHLGFLICLERPLHSPSGRAAPKHDSNQFGFIICAGQKAADQIFDSKQKPRQKVSVKKQTQKGPSKAGRPGGR